MQGSTAKDGRGWKSNGDGHITGSGMGRNYRACVDYPQCDARKALIWTILEKMFPLLRNFEDGKESRRLVPHQNATTMQVAVSVVAACLWMFENPRRGLCVPDDLPHDFVLGFSKPYLGKFVSVASDWTPLKHYSNFFHGYNKPQVNTSDPWQFKNFLITEGDGI